MNRQKSLNNKGFSLVELIIVIAIMAILIGVMAPNLLRYVERTNVSADTQLADSIRLAITTAIMDPAVEPDDVAAYVTTARQAATGVAFTTGLQNTMLNSVAQTLGYPAGTTATVLETGLLAELRSSHVTAPGITVEISAQNAVIVYLTGTDATGSRDPATGHDISAPQQPAPTVPSGT